MAEKLIALRWTPPIFEPHKLPIKQGTIVSMLDPRR